MKKHTILLATLVAVVGLMAAYASTAFATPTQKSPCSGCHSSDPAVVVSVTQVSNDGTNATYNLSVTNPYGLNGWAVFSGSTKLAGAAAGSATFSVADGKTYTVFGVSGDGNGTEGYGSTTISPTAPADVTAPVTTSNAVATYVSNATITLSATDSGSGVAATYYKLDGGAQVAGTSIVVNTVGSHSIEFWSVDVAGNVEAHKTASFTITAPAPVDVTAPVTTSNAVATYVSNATITLSATDAGSGVAATYYSLDGGPQVAGTSVSVSSVGAHTLQFWSVDVAGNVELPKTAGFTITAPAPVDVTAPVTTSNAVATYVSNATIKLTATDAGSGVAHTYYILDGGSQVEGTSISVSTVGSHSIEFWSVDVAGNVEAHKTASFAITGPAPVPSPDPTPTPSPDPTPTPTPGPTHHHSDDGSRGDSRNHRGSEHQHEYSWGRVSVPTTGTAGFGSDD